MPDAGFKPTTSKVFSSNRSATTANQVREICNFSIFQFYSLHKWPDPAVGYYSKIVGCREKVGCELKSTQPHISYVLKWRQSNFMRMLFWPHICLGS